MVLKIPLFVRNCANTITLRLKEDLKLTVNGFNGSRTYKARIVEVCLEIGTKAFKIPATVLPEIEV